MAKRTNPRWGWRRGQQDSCPPTAAPRAPPWHRFGFILATQLLCMFQDQGGRWLFPLASPKYPLQFLLDPGHPAQHLPTWAEEVPTPPVLWRSPRASGARDSTCHVQAAHSRATLRTPELWASVTSTAAQAPALAARPRSWPRGPRPHTPHPPLQQASLSPGLRGPPSPVQPSPSQDPPGTWPSRLKKRHCAPAGAHSLHASLLALLSDAHSQAYS